MFLFASDLSERRDDVSSYFVFSLLWWRLLHKTGLVGQMRGAVLHPGDARLGIGRRGPVSVRQGLVLAGAVEADQIRGTRRLDAAFPGQTPQHLLVILAAVPADQAAQRGIGRLGR